MNTIFKAGLLSIFLIAFSFVIATEPVVNPNKKVIVLDAGHGGDDDGAKFEDFKEKNYTLAIAKRIMELNRNENVEIILLRDSDEFIDLNKRVDRINELNPDLVISLHVNNSSNTSLNGMEVYYSDLNEQHEVSKEYAEKLHSSFKNGPFEQRGVKNFRLKVVRESKCPAVLLEMGFISNDKDRLYLSNDSSQKDIAQKVLNFIYLI